MKDDVYNLQRMITNLSNEVINDSQKKLINEILNGKTIEKEYYNKNVISSIRIEYSLSREKLLDLLEVPEKDRYCTHIIIE